MMLLFQLASMGVLAIAAAQDYRARWVSPFLPLFLLAYGIIGGALNYFSVSIAGLMFFYSLMMWRHGYMGGGDAKLLPAAVFVAEPLEFLGWLLVTMLLTGGLVTFVNQYQRRKLLLTRFPLAVLIALAYLFALLR